MTYIYRDPQRSQRLADLKAQAGLPRNQPGSAPYTRVYLPTGKAIHLLPPASRGSATATALCGMFPAELDVWCGTSTRREWDKAAKGQFCQRCRDEYNRLEGN